MENIRILDCTLRDGGRLIDCDFTDFHISGITQGLAESKIDIIEMGFLRDKIDYKEGTAFFTDLNQIMKYIPDKSDAIYALFMDYGMVDLNVLPPCTGSGITAIRFAFRKKDYKAALPCLYEVKNKGYKLFVQTVESMNYTREELENVINDMNVLQPYSFGIVDTFGAMYKKDVTDLYSFINSKLDENICINFHSHNNMQLSFAHAQEIVGLAGTDRNVILDATLEGIGKGAGNLNTELITDFLNRHSSKYDMDRLLDTIDRHIFWIKSKHTWGYSIPGYLSGVYSSHPNNVAYLLNMHKLQTKDIGYILSMIDPETRKVYDYSNIDQKYIEYFDSKYDDTENLKMLADSIGQRDVLIIVFGASINQYEEKIKALTQNKETTVTISVNFEYDENTDYIFYGNNMRYTQQKDTGKFAKKIITSNIKSASNGDITVNLNKLIDRRLENFDNSTIMLMNLLFNIGVTNILVAGLDGYETDNAEKSVASKDFSYNLNPAESAKRNEVIGNLLRDRASRLAASQRVTFVTPSRFESIFTGTRKDIKMLVMDVDGTLTDGKIYMSGSGEAFKAFSIKDGYALYSMDKDDIIPVIITGRQSDIVAKRAGELGIKEVYQAVSDKTKIINDLCAKYHLSKEEIAYIGDDLNDIEAMQMCGFKACPADACEQVRQLCDYVSEYNGGEGAVRDICDRVLQRKM